MEGSFSQGTMQGSINRFFSEDAYYIKSNFNVKILRVFNIKREEGYIISLKDFLVTKINHKKKKYTIYSISEFLENDENNAQGGPPERNEENEENEENENVNVQISENVEVLNNFETRKAEIIIKDDENDQELKMNIWFTEKTLKAPIIELTREKLKDIFNGSIPPSLGFNEMNIPFEDYDINKDAVNVKFETINKNGTFTYSLLEYSSKDSLPDIFKIPKNYKKVKKL